MIENLKRLGAKYTPFKQKIFESLNSLNSYVLWHEEQNGILQSIVIMQNLNKSTTTNCL
jgi:hypothetical protein